MKSQDIFLLLKLYSLEVKEKELLLKKKEFISQKEWIDWEDEYILEDSLISDYSMRGLSTLTGISKSEINLALKRCYKVKLAILENELLVPRVNANALKEFIIHGISYVFPVEKGVVTRGIATALGAPILQGKIMTAGDLLPVWPDAYGKTKGESVLPLYKTVPMAVRKDAFLYALLALVDAIRMGNARERNYAINEIDRLIK